MSDTTLMVFPCHFPIKIIGNNVPAFLEEIKQTVRRHFPGFDLETLKKKPSEKGNFLAITVTVFAENQATLDAFYTEVGQHPEIKMVL